MRASVVAVRRLRRSLACVRRGSGAAASARSDRVAVLVGGARWPAAAAVLSSPHGWRRVAADRLRARDHKVEYGAVAVVAESMADLRAVCPWLLRAGRSAEVTLVALATDRPEALGSPVAVPGVEVLGARRVRRGGGLAVTVRLAEPAPVLEVARAALGARAAERRPRPAAGLRLGITDAAALPWAAGDRAARMVGPRTAIAREAEHELVDVLVGPQVHESPDPRVPRLAVTESTGPLQLPPVDTAVISPAGFRREAAGTGAVQLAAGSGSAPATLRLAGADGAPIGGGDLRAGLTENHVAALRALAGVEVRSETGVAPGHLGRVLSQLACAGVPARARELSAPVAEALGPDLAARLSGTDLAALADPTARESWSVAARRTALGRFAPDAYWRAWAAGNARPAAPAPSVSVLLGTRRAEFVPFALAQVQRQDWAEVETVLVLHGITAAADPVRAAVADFTRPLQVVEVGADVVFGQALNAGLERCGGTLITKMDDDDWYGPHHLTDLVLARGYSGATVVGMAGIELYLHGSDATARWTGRACEGPETWLAGPTQLLGTADLREFGGWRATPSAVDWHLLRAVTAAGGTLYATHSLGFLYYRGRTHTWRPSGGEETWLRRSPDRRPGFDPPPHLDPLPHPAMGSVRIHLEA